MIAPNVPRQTARTTIKSSRANLDRGRRVANRIESIARAPREDEGSWTSTRWNCWNSTKSASCWRRHAACAWGRKPRLDRTEPQPRRDRRSSSVTTEMTEALSSGLSPPLGSVRDIRAHVQRARSRRRSKPTSSPRSLRSSARSATSIAGWRAGESFPRLSSLKQDIGEFSGVVLAIEGCLDSRGTVLDTASRRLSEIRREIHQVEERIQETLRRMLRSPEIRRILRYANFTMVGHHYVLPIAKDHRGEIQGSVHRTSSSNETVYVEPQAIAEHSAQLSFLRAREHKEIRRVLRWLSAQVGQVADSILGTLETVAHIDLIHARGQFALDFRMNRPDLQQNGPVVLRAPDIRCLNIFSD